MFSAIKDYGIVGRAVKNGQVNIQVINPRNFTTDNYKRIDERPFGGGPGMVMMAEPLEKAILYAKELAGRAGCDIQNGRCPVVYLSPQGKTLSEPLVATMPNLDGMILLCGRYEGIDERLITCYVDQEISIGDYVLTGGELPAMVLMDSVIRRLPKIMGDDLSAEQDSFVDGLLDCPHYTKPLDFHGQTGPSVLISGHRTNIHKWCFLELVKRTKARRPELWQNFIPNKQQAKWLKDLED